MVDLRDHFLATGVRFYFDITIDYIVLMQESVEQISISEFDDFKLTAPKSLIKLSEEPKYILFISDIGLSPRMGNKEALKVKNLCKCLRGTLDDMSREKIVKASNIARVVIARISIASDNGTKRATEILDLILSQLGQVIDVDVMPGENEECLSMKSMPQRPIHAVNLPESSKLQTATDLSNRCLLLCEQVCSKTSVINRVFFTTRDLYWL